jgi:hypothetical protein
MDMKKPLDPGLRQGDGAWEMQEAASSAMPFWLSGEEHRA